jgi:glycosyltransferase involved in cell wall biosynthesis
MAVIRPLSVSPQGPTRLVQTRGLSVLHIVAPASVGGLERVVASLAIGQQASGLDVSVAAVVNGDGDSHPFVTECRGAGIDVHPVTVAGRDYRGERRAVATLCQRLTPHVVHTHGYRPDVIDAGVARRLGIPSVTTFHGFTGGEWRNRLYERAQRWSARRFDAVVAVSQPIAEQLMTSGVRHDRLWVVANAHQPRSALLDREAARQALGLSATAFIVGWVGRISPEKGPDVLLDALGCLDDRSISASFIGEGPLRQALEAQASERGLASRANWHGLVPDAARYLRAFDAFILSSRTEGTPIALFEAMHAGTPIVATRVGGVPAVLRPADAILVPAEDPHAIAAAISRLRAEPSEARARAASARARLDRDYRTGPWLARYETIYRGIAASSLIRHYRT